MINYDQLNYDQLFLMLVDETTFNLQTVIEKRSKVSKQLKITL